VEFRRHGASPRRWPWRPFSRSPGDRQRPDSDTAAMARRVDRIEPELHVLKAKSRSGVEWPRFDRGPKQGPRRSPARPRSPGLRRGRPPPGRPRPPAAASPREREDRASAVRVAARTAAVAARLRPATMTIRETWRKDDPLEPETRTSASFSSSRSVPGLLPQGGSGSAPPSGLLRRAGRDGARSRSLPRRFTVNRRSASSERQDPLRRPPARRRTPGTSSSGSVVTIGTGRAAKGANGRETSVTGPREAPSALACWSRAGGPDHTFPSHRVGRDRLARGPRSRGAADDRRQPTRRPRPPRAARRSRSPAEVPSATGTTRRWWRLSGAAPSRATGSRRGGHRDDGVPRHREPTQEGGERHDPRLSLPPARPGGSGERGRARSRS